MQINAENAGSDERSTIVVVVAGDGWKNSYILSVNLLLSLTYCEDE